MKQLQHLGIWVVALSMVAMGIFIFFSPITIFIARLQHRGSFSQTQAQQSNCMGKEVICVMKNGKIVSKPLTKADISMIHTQYATEHDQRIAYATNVAVAVMAIRAYTHIPDLNLTLFTQSIPTHITYYCSPDKKCWAVDNQTHQVVPNEM